MYPTIRGRRQPQPTILTVYRPIEDYWESAQALRLESSGSFEPLDAFLVHRLLDLIPGDPLVIDEAMGATGGASCLLGLNHPRVRSVWAVADRGSPQSASTLSALSRHLEQRGAGTAPLEVADRQDLAIKVADRPGAVILMHAGPACAASLTEAVAWWLERRPDALILVLGLGRVGYCPAMASLMNLCTPESEMRFELLRELSEVLIASRLGLVARRDDPGLSEALERLRLAFSGNYRYIDLLRQANDAALSEAQIDDETLRKHHAFWPPLAAEIEGLRRIARDAEERAAAAAEELRRTRMISVPLEKLRCSLSPTPVGGAWRLAKRVRRRLSPTPVGGAWRLAKRRIGSYLGRGR
jgi:hypothetical protein